MALTKVRGSGIDADGQEIILDADGDTSIAVGTDDVIVVDTAGSERMRVDASGNVGIGTTSPSADLSVNGRITLGDQSGSGTAGAGSMIVGANALFIQASENKDSSNRVPIIFSNMGGSTESMRLTSDGHLLINRTTTASGSKAMIDFQDGGRGLGIIGPSSGGGTQAMHFYTGGTQVGSISLDTSSTSFNTSSDYRLKENVVTDWDATTRLKQLKPSRFNFIADADTTVDGFLAHEVSSIVPEAITGTKDAVDENGNPEYQSIDQSKLVPLLVKTIQELEARITALENA